MSKRNILIGSLVIFFIASISVLIWGGISQLRKISNIQDITKVKVNYDIEKISDNSLKNEIVNSNINIHLFPFTQDPAKYPLSYTVPTGRYEYNFLFSGDRIDINLGTDTEFLDQDISKMIISRLIIAAAMQKSEKNIRSGSLFDSNLKDDHFKYLNKILNDEKLFKLVFINLSS